VSGIQHGMSGCGVSTGERQVGQCSDRWAITF
jgi:hypothetical protein